MMAGSRTTEERRAKRRARRAKGKREKGRWDTGTKDDRMTGQAGIVQDLGRRGTALHGRRGQMPFDLGGRDRFARLHDPLDHPARS